MSFRSVVRIVLIIYQAKRYDVKGKQILKTQAKYYIADLGLRYLLYGLKGQDEGIKIIYALDWLLDK